MALKCPNCECEKGFIGVGNRGTYPLFRCRVCKQDFTPEEINQHNGIEEQGYN
jgi:rubredoxin